MKKITLVAFITFIVDRIVKVIITNNFALNVRNKVIDRFFYITNCHNDGAAFSLFSGNTIFLIFITLIVLFIIYRTITKYKNINIFSIISYGLLLGGIIGNLYDRLIFGYVIDYLDFIIFNYDFPIFNIADICIVIGAFILIFFERSEKDERKNIS